MFRNIILTALVAVGTVTGLAMTPSTAEATPPSFFGRFGNDHGRHNHSHFEVLYRHGNHWDSYGKNRDRDDAERAARQLRFKGYQVRIERDRAW
jgi:hypothetical protein